MNTIKLAPNNKKPYDHQLVFTAQKLKNGANTHDLNGSLCVYQLAYSNAQSFEWNDYSCEMFEMATARLRKHVKEIQAENVGVLI